MGKLVAADGIHALALVEPAVRCAAGGQRVVAIGQQQPRRHPAFHVRARVDPVVGDRRVGALFPDLRFGLHVCRAQLAVGIPALRELARSDLSLALAAAREVVDDLPGAVVVAAGVVEGALGPCRARPVHRHFPHLGAALIEDPQVVVVAALDVGGYGAHHAFDGPAARVAEIGVVERRGAETARCHHLGIALHGRRFLTQRLVGAHRGERFATRRRFRLGSALGLLSGGGLVALSLAATERRLLGRVGIAGGAFHGRLDGKDADGFPRRLPRRPGFVRGVSPDRRRDRQQGKTEDGATSVHHDPLPPRAPATARPNPGTASKCSSA